MLTYMRARVVDLVGPVASRMWVRTFHSACARILRREAERGRLPGAFSIYDQDDSVRSPVTSCPTWA